MRDLGLLYWQRRLVRSGWRTEQTSNQYVLKPEAPAPMITVRLPVLCDRQTDGETRFCLIKRPEPSAAEVWEAQKALAQARAVMEQRLLGKGCGMLPAT
jgi:hypothetical protein